MTPGPSKTAEALVAVLLPPSRRQEVLGDLYERFQSPQQYAVDALRTIPLVVASRIRRNSDPQIALIEALTMYLAYVAAAWYLDRAFLWTNSALWFLAVPPLATMVVFALWDAYAGSRRNAILCVALGALFAFGAGGVPSGILLCGVAMIAVLILAVRLLFPRFAAPVRLFDPRSIAVFALLWLLSMIHK